MTSIDSQRVDSQRVDSQRPDLQAAAASDLAVRPLSETDLDDILDLDSSAFGQDPPRDFLDDLVVPYLERSGGPLPRRKRSER